MSDNPRKLDFSLPMDNTDIEYLVNTVLFHFKSSKEAQRMNKETLESCFSELSKDVKKLFKENEDTVQSLSWNLRRLIKFVDEAFGTIVNSIEERSGATLKRLGTLEKKMSRLEAVIIGMDEKLSLIVDKLPSTTSSENLEIAEGKFVINGNSNGEVSLVETKEKIGMTSIKRISDSIGDAIQYSLSDSESSDEYFPFNINDSHGMNVQRIASDDEDYYDIPDELEQEYTDNLVPIEDIIQGIQDDDAKSSISSNCSDCSQSTKGSNVSISVSPTEKKESYITTKIEPVDNFHFKPISSNSNEGSVKNITVVDKNCRDVEVAMGTECCPQVDLTDGSVSKKEYQNKTFDIQDNIQEPIKLSKESSFNILPKCEVPCRLYYQNLEDLKFNLMGQATYKVISDNLGGSYTLVFEENASKKSLFSVKLNENINFMEMNKTYIMFKYISKINGYEYVNNHCIEFDNEAETNNFIDTIQSYFCQ